MTKEEIVEAVTQRVSGQMSASEVGTLVAAAMRDFPAQAPHADLPQAQEVVTEAVIDNVSSEMPSGGEPREIEEQEQPCCFLCQYDYDLGELTIRDPYVILPDGTIEVPEVPTLSPGSTYYCVVTREEGEEGEAATYEVEITDENQAGEEGVVACVPICMVDNDGGFVTVRQYHVGAVIVGAADVKPADGSGLVVNESGELDLDGREEDDEFKVVELKDEDGEVIAKVLATEEFSLSGVETLNEKDGKVNIIGGKHIRVESESEQTIKISYDEDKEGEDGDPNAEKDDPCGHPGDKDGGGGGSGVSGGEGGGVGPDGQGEPHIGDNHCQGCGCS